MKKISYTFYLFIFIFLTSCAPQSKETYLKDYNEFINEINENKNTYTAEDWKKTDEKYKKYSNDWKEKFADEFTWKEKIILTKNEVEYNFYKVKESSTGFFETFIKEDYEKIKKQIQYYSENDMDKDIEFILKQAEELGGTAEETINKILKELDIDLKEYQKE